MRLSDAPPLDARPLLAAERSALLAVLRSLDAADWGLSTPCPGWDVKDICLHVLGEDLGRLSRDRDGDLTGLISTGGGYRDFVAALDAKNEQWVSAARDLSGRVVSELLAVTGPLLDQYHAGLDMGAPARVAWVGPEPVPAWFDVARYLTERWVHQQQIRAAVNRPGLDGPDYLGPVLRTFVWALPHHYRDIAADSGSVVAVEIAGPGGGDWVLTRRDDGWELDAGSQDEATARVAVDSDAAWRLFTAALDDAGAVRREGPPHLTEPFLDARAIIV